MSIPLFEEKRSEAPLITFTLCVPAAVGIVVLSMVYELTSYLGGSGREFLRPSSLLGLTGGCALLLTIVGMLASMAHLAKPIRAPFSLRHLQSSWLSREIAAVGIYGLFIAVWYAGGLLDNLPGALIGLLGAAVFGIALLFVIAEAYKVSTRPAWLGSECSMELIASACGSGAALFLLCLSLDESIGIEGGLGSLIGRSGADALASIALSCVFLVAAIVLGICAHRSRYRRLLSLCEESDERVALTVANYENHRSTIRIALRIELIAVVAGIIGACLCGFALSSSEPMALLDVGTVTFCFVATVLELVAHGMQRWLFYEIPVPVRYVALLRK